MVEADDVFKRPRAPGDAHRAPGDAPRPPCEPDASLLSPHASTTDDGDTSDTESVGSSVHVPDDDLVQNVMYDVTDLPDDVTSSETAEDRRKKYMSLPAKLSYLEYYMKYQCNIDEASAHEGEH